MAVDSVTGRATTLALVQRDSILEGTASERIENDTGAVVQFLGKEAVRGRTRPTGSISLVLRGPHHARRYAGFLRSDSLRLVRMDSVGPLLVLGRRH